MGTKDISRVAFDTRKHYDSVRMQQGRVIVDDDWNENERIRIEDQRRGWIDVIGSAGSPDTGFRIAQAYLANNQIEFDIEAGTFYLGGLGLEMDEDETYRTQSDYLEAKNIQHAAPTAGRVDLVYLEAFQEPVGAVEDQELFEVALGGSDTSMRIRTRQRVHLLEDVKDSCNEAWQQFVSTLEGTLSDEYELERDVKLTVVFVPGGDPADLCRPHVVGGYLGAQNQAIRVQLVDEDHLTWSFDNASSLYRVQLGAKDGEWKKVTLKTDPKDEAHWPLADQIVEIVPCSAKLPNGEWVAEMQGHLSSVATSYNPDDGSIELTTPIPASDVNDWLGRVGATSLADPGVCFFMRVWDRGADVTSPAKIQFTPGTPITLGKTGLKVTITGNERILGDYWIIAVRPDAPQEVVPWDLTKGRRPHGVRRFYAPLALIHWKFENSTFAEAEVRDCRRTFRPLTRQKTCCTYTVGDGKVSHGDFDSIEEALEHLPPSGGKICVLPGQHEANVVIDEKSNIRIAGCDKKSLVIPRQSDRLAPIFLVRSSECIALEHMDLVTLEGTAIVLEGSELGGLLEIEVRYNRILAYQHAIHATQGVNINIHHNKIRMLDKERGDVAIYISGEDGLIERNDISVVTAGTVPPPEDIPEDVETPDPTDPCVDPESVYSNWLYLGVYVDYVWAMALGALYPPNPFKALGGIQIASGSERIRVFENTIVGGAGNGITLGSDLALEELAGKAEGIPDVLAFIYDVSIDRNLISNMALSGIGIPVVSLAELAELEEWKRIIEVQPQLVHWLLMVNYFGMLGGFAVNLSIYRNHIIRCVQRSFDPSTEGQALARGLGGISLGLCEDLRIRENRIENNGTNHLNPVCGIFVLYVDQVDISQNQVLDNGPAIIGTDVDLGRGVWGGIVTLLATSVSLANRLTQSRAISAEGGHAARIYGNVVDQPVGRALTMGAFGPLSVLSNRFSSAFSGPELLDKLVGAVLIVNLGGLHGITSAQISIAQAKAANTNPGAARRRVWSGLSGIMQPHPLFPNGNTLFNDNQTRLGFGSRSAISQLIVTLDDLGFDGNQSDMLVSLPTSLHEIQQVLQINTLLGGITLRASDNRFKEMMQERLGMQGLSLLTISLVMNNTTHNQGNHCIIAANLMESTLPRVSMGNQVLVPGGIESCLKNEEAFARQPALLLKPLIGLLLRRR